MNKPLLSICIPTYNRSFYLKNSLNSVICQKEFKKGNVEIVISDNASTDDTESVVKEYVSKYENIRYFRNAENIRDQNFPVALSRGKGLYRKLSNDTLLYCPGSLRYICGLVQRYKETNEILHFFDGKGKNLEKKIVECENFDQFVGMVSWLSQWIGSFGIWENECRNLANDFSGCELMLWQCQKLYELMAAKGRAIFINRRLFFVQEVSGKDMSYGLYQVMHLNFLSILNNYMEKGLLSQKTYEKVRIDNFYLFSTFFTRGKHKNKQWNFGDKEKIENLVINEVKQAGCWRDYQKSYKKNKLLCPLRTDFKIVFLHIYSTFLSFRVKLAWKKKIKSKDGQ